MSDHVRSAGSPEWYDDPTEVAATEAMLVRAGVLSWSPRALPALVAWIRDGVDMLATSPATNDVSYYRSKPWKWSRERTIARILERTWEQAVIPVEEAWEMSGQEIMARMQEQDAKRGLR